jgi:hypothetical protein
MVEIITMAMAINPSTDEEHFKDMVIKVFKDTTLAETKVVEVLGGAVSQVVEATMVDIIAAEEETLEDDSTIIIIS